ncbi:hypothetical protein FO519_002412 [Halicephalobus sp. NKZ332]|nr:hypothetical protein FO519_002412 [Halicephalobus sp. NKZ332]
MARTGRSHEMEEIDLSDRRGLIAMAEIYSRGAAAYSNNAFDDGSVNFVRSRSRDDITKILHNTGIVKAHSSPMAPISSSQNGTTDSSVKFRGNRPAGKRVSCTLLNLLILLAIMGLLLFASILITYFLTVTSVNSQVGPSLNSTKNDTPISPPEELPQPEEQYHSGPTPDELRLQKNILPIWYNLTIRVYVPGFVEFDDPEKSLTFSSALMMKLFVKEKTNKIELNSLGLDLPTNITEYGVLVEGVNPSLISESSSNSDESFTVVKKSSKEAPESDVIARLKRDLSRSPSGVSVTKVTVNETLEKVIFDLSGDLEEGKEYIFQFRYKGPISNKLAGLYLTTYKDPEGQNHYAAVTQMEPTDARRMVPCFDEPGFRAIWKIKILHPKGSKAVSNAKEIEEDQADEKIPGFLWTSFEETPKMASYLLAIVVSDFDFIEGQTNRGTRFRIWSRKEAINETQYALNMMAFPDFAAGAMENWGLVTYRERALLYNPAVYSLLNKQYIATVVAHELGVDSIDSTFKMDDWFVKDSLSIAFERDAMATSHPLSFPIEKAEDVSEAFDSISYDKGASILRMLSNILGEENFKKGLNIYLNRYAYSNAEHVDLWNALTEAVPDSLRDWNGKKFDVDEFAKKWTEQMGYPVVTVSTTKNGVKLAQKRFKIDETSEESPKFKNPKYWYKWDIPIWYTVDGAHQPVTWLHSEEEINFTNPNSLVFINSESNGFYRVKYDHDQMEKINKQLSENHTAIQMRSRARYIDDAFTLAQAGQISYEEVLEMTRYLYKENDYLPITMAINGFGGIAGYFGDEPESEFMRAYLRPMFDEKYEKVKEKVFEQEEDKDFYANVMSTLIVRTACDLKNEDCTDRALKSYQEKLVAPCNEESTAIVPPSIRTFVYCLGIKYGNEKDWNNMLRLFQKESCQVERDRLIHALSCSRDTFTLKKLLKMAVDINNTVIRLQDKDTVFSFVGFNYAGKPIVFEFFTQNWNQLYHDLKDQQTLLKKFVQAALEGKTLRRVQEIEDFLVANKATTQNLDVFKQQLEIIRTNAKWMDKNYDNLVAWFKNASGTAITKREIGFDTA